MHSYSRRSLILTKNFTINQMWPILQTSVSKKCIFVFLISELRGHLEDSLQPDTSYALSRLRLPDVGDPAYQKSSLQGAW